MQLSTERTLVEVGFECSDPNSFHSSVHGGFRNRAATDPGDSNRTLLDLEHGRLAYRMAHDETARSTTIDVEFLEDSPIYDLVCRWVLPGGAADHGEIGDEIVPRGSELYHQHACSSLRLGDSSIEIVGVESTPPGMRPEMYLRCEHDASDRTGYRWIVHARFISCEDEPAWLKHIDGTSTRFEGHPVERAVLLRRRELAAPIYETQIQPHVTVRDGTRCRVGLRSSR